MKWKNWPEAISYIENAKNISNVAVEEFWVMKTISGERNTVFFPHIYIYNRLYRVRSYDVLKGKFFLSFLFDKERKMERLWKKEIGKKMTKTHMGFERECCWSWFFCHECCRKRDGKRNRRITRLLDIQGKWAVWFDGPPLPPFLLHLYNNI